MATVLSELSELFIAVASSTTRDASTTDEEVEKEKEFMLRLRGGTSVLQLVGVEMVRFADNSNRLYLPARSQVFSVPHCPYSPTDKIKQFQYAGRICLLLPYLH